MALPEIELKTQIDDGTEFRSVLLRVRAGDIARVVDAISNGGFCRGGPPRIMVVDDNKLSLSILTNTGKQGEYIALALDIFIPLNKQELTLLDPQPEPVIPVVTEP